MTSLEPNEPITEEVTRNSPPMCEICGENPSKYCCPGCNRRTCSLGCVKLHKERFQCTGKRDRLKYVPIKEFNDRTLLSDYRLLEEVQRAGEVAQRCRPAAPRAQLPPRLSTLVYQASRRNVHLLLMSPGMARRKCNTSYWNNRTRTFVWRVEWRFPSAVKPPTHSSGGAPSAPADPAPGSGSGSPLVWSESDQLACTDEHVPDSMTLREVLAKHIAYRPGSAAKQHLLAAYDDAGVDNLTVLMKKHKTPSNSPAYFRLPLDAPLRTALANKTIVEFPMFLVLLPHEVDAEVDTDTNNVFAPLAAETASSFNPDGTSSATDGTVNGREPTAGKTKAVPVEEGDEEEADELDLAEGRDTKRTRREVDGGVIVAAAGQQGPTPSSSSSSSSCSSSSAAAAVAVAAASSNPSSCLPAGTHLPSAVIQATTIGRRRLYPIAPEPPPRPQRDANFHSKDRRDECRTNVAAAAAGATVGGSAAPSCPAQADTPMLKPPPPPLPPPQQQPSSSSSPVAEAGVGLLESLTQKENDGKRREADADADAGAGAGPEAERMRREAGALEEAERELPAVVSATVEERFGAGEGGEGPAKAKGEEEAPTVAEEEDTTLEKETPVMYQQFIDDNEIDLE